MTLSKTGTTVRLQREGLGISAEHVANEAGLSISRLAEIEMGTYPTTWELSRLAQALGTDPAALWRGDTETSAKRSTARFRAPWGIQKLPAADARLLARLAEAGRISNQVPPAERVV